MAEPKVLPPLRPKHLEELAEGLRSTAEAGGQVQLIGSNCCPLNRFDPGRPVQPVSMLRLTQISENNVPPGSVTVEGGVTLDVLQRHLGWQNRWLPVDPPGVAGRAPGSRSLGGLVATHALGPLRVGHAWQELIAHLDWMDAAGMLHRAEGTAAEAWIGSMGGLGAIARITLRVQPRPAEERAVVFFCDALSQCEQMLGALASGERAAYVQAAARRTFRQNPLQLPVNAGVLVVGYLGEGEEVEQQALRLRGLPAMRGREAIGLSGPQAARLRLWMASEPGEPGLGQGEAQPLAVRVHATGRAPLELLTELESLTAALGASPWFVAEAWSGLVRGVVRGLTAGQRPRFLSLLHGTIRGAAALVLPPGEAPISLGLPPDLARLHQHKAQYDPRGVFGAL